MSDTMLGKRSGWLTFAGIMLIVAGFYNALSGIAALSDDETVAARATEVLLGIDLTAWGWFLLIAGALQLLAGILILRQNVWGLWLGVIFACLSAFMTVFMIFAFPLWGMAVLTIDILILYGLLTRSDEFAS